MYRVREFKWVVGVSQRATGGIMVLGLVGKGGIWSPKIGAASGRLILVNHHKKYASIPCRTTMELRGHQR